MKKLLVLFTPVLFVQLAFGQLDMKQYSTSYAYSRDGKLVLITARAYNGIFSVPVSDIQYQRGLTIHDQLEMDGSNRPKDFTVLYTHDTAGSYFFVSGINLRNRHNYQYRILENGKRPIRNWTSFEEFSKDDFQAGNFKGSLGMLGSYRTNRDNFLVVDIRKERSDSILITNVVVWQSITPRLLNIYTSSQFNNFFSRLKKTYDFTLSLNERKYWEEIFGKDQIDSISGLPKNIRFKEDEENIIFLIAANIYSANALEYSVSTNSKIVTDWKKNDYDNNFIWLHRLPPGKYKINLRYSSQPDNISTIDFEIYRNDQVLSTKILWGSLLAAFFALLVFGRMYFFAKKRLLKNEEEKRNLINELGIVRHQLSPHFIFNAMNSIQGLVNTDQSEKASFYLTEFGFLLRQTLHYSDKLFIPLSEELKVLEAYISLEKLRFKFSFDLLVAGGIQTDMIELPPLLLQPIVENSIKHGISDLREKGKVEIRIYRQNQHLVLQISDNGKGFDNQKIAGGWGLRLTRERVKLVNKIEQGREILMETRSDVDKTTITFTFQNWLT